MSRARMTNLLIFTFYLFLSLHTLTSFLEHSSAKVKNILMALGRIIEQADAECSMQECQPC